MWVRGEGSSRHTLARWRWKSCEMRKQDGFLKSFGPFFKVYSSFLCYLSLVFEMVGSLWVREGARGLFSYLFSCWDWVSVKKARLSSGTSGSLRPCVPGDGVCCPGSSSASLRIGKETRFEPYSLLFHFKAWILGLWGLMCSDNPPKPPLSHGSPLLCSILRLFYSFIHGVQDSQCWHSAKLPNSVQCTAHLFILCVWFLKKIFYVWTKS